MWIEIQYCDGVTYFNSYQMDSLLDKTWYTVQQSTIASGTASLAQLHWKRNWDCLSREMSSIAGSLLFYSHTIFFQKNIETKLIFRKRPQHKLILVKECNTFNSVYQGAPLSLLHRFTYLVCKRLVRKYIKQWKYWIKPYICSVKAT